MFTSERDGSADIYRVHIAGSGLERLTNEPSFDDQAVLSPDGSRLAFVSTRGRGTADIWILDLKSRRLRNLTGGAGSNFRPQWSPDGKWIALSSDRNTVVRRRSRIESRAQFVRDEVAYLTKAGDHAGLGFTRRGFGAAGSMRNPAWSPDGNRVVYQKLDSAPRPPDQPLFSKNAKKFEFASSNLFPAFSPGGKLVTTMDFNGIDHASLSVMDANGGHARRSFDERGGMALAPSWSPDGQWIVFGFGGCSS